MSRSSSHMSRSALQIISSPPAQEVIDFLAGDLLFGAYAAGYLHAPWSQAAQFTLAVASDDESSNALVVRYDERPQSVLHLFGGRWGLIAALSEDNLSGWRRTLRQGGQDIWLSGYADALDAVTGFFYPLERRFLERWVLDSASLRIPEHLLPYVAQGPWHTASSHHETPSSPRSLDGYSSSPHSMVPRLLQAADARLLNCFFGLPGSDSFGDEELERCAYYGVFIPPSSSVEEQCIAVAGTLVTAQTQHIAAIGNVYTSPYWRGQGYATACVAALCAYQFAQGYQYIVLNVDQDNTTAQGVYQRLGFRSHCAFQEVRAVAL